MKSWPTVKLADVATLSSGGTPSKANPAFWDGDIPWVSPKDMKTNHLTDAEDRISPAAIAESAARIVGSDSVLAVVRSGILAHTFPVATLERDVSFNQDIKAITPVSESLLTPYLFWVLKGQEARILSGGVKKGATVHSLSNGFLEALTFCLPPLEEQRRIVGLLDRAAEIRRRADAARSHARAIVPALFTDMFGDPATNPKGWSVTTVDSVLSYTRYGPRFPNRPYSDTGAHILRTTDMGFDGTLRWWEAPIMPVTQVEVSKYKLEQNTVLVTRTGATIGKVALFTGAERPCIAGAYLIELGVNGEIVGEYLLHLLMSSYGQSHLVRGSRAVAQPNINAPTIRAIPIPLPPLPLQTAFAEQVRRIEATARALDAAAAKAEAMAAALSAEVFDAAPANGRVAEPAVSA